MNKLYYTLENIHRYCSFGDHNVSLPWNKTNTQSNFYVQYFHLSTVAESSFCLHFFISQTAVCIHMTHVKSIKMFRCAFKVQKTQMQQDNILKETNS